jgi:uncharacterized 2Fe-2S/4Fe-4S cluster protein (DUF4445 family)
MMSFPEDRFRKLGNTALMGAKMFLFPEESATGPIMDITSHVNLESEPDFQDIYIKNLTFDIPTG